MATVSGNGVITLPLASDSDFYDATGGKSRELTILHKPGSSGTCTINTQNSQLIFTVGGPSGGATSVTLAVNRALSLRSFGTGWAEV